jgi:hypothetical protein
MGALEVVTREDEVHFGCGWIAAALDRFAKLVPDGYPAYGRILHPAEEPRGEGWAPVSWASVAARTGRAMHPLVQFERLVAGAGWEGTEPDIGRLPDGELGALLRLLAGATGTPDRCWYCVWDGYGELTGAVASLTASSDEPLGILDEAIASFHAVFDQAEGALRSLAEPSALPEPAPATPGWPRLRLPGRDYVVLRGPLFGAPDAGRGLAPAATGRLGPNLWWPEDRAWVVASEIDLDSTYVAGSRALVDHILAAPALEAFESFANAPVDVDSDTINR